jgi:hypothetical protein
MMGKNKDIEQRHIFICSCYSLDHLIAFYYDREDFELHIQTRINPEYGFFKRIWLAIKYIFGYRSRFGEYDDFIFNPDDMEKLRWYINMIKSHEQKLN